VSDAPGATPATALAEAIRFAEVAYGFADRPPILDGLNLSIRAGERIAIVGFIGSGKTTVLRLLARFADPDKGGIHIDGRDLRDLTQASLREQIGVVFQNSLLIDDTIRENIRMGKLDAATRRSKPSLRSSGSIASLKPCRAATTRWSAREENGCRVVSANSLQSRVR